MCPVVTVKCSPPTKGIVRKRHCCCMNKGRPHTHVHIFVQTVGGRKRRYDSKIIHLYVLKKMFFLYKISEVLRHIMLPNVIHIFTLIDFLASSSKRNNNTLLWPYPHCCWWYIPIYAQKGQQLKGCTIIIMYHWSYRQICLTEFIGNIFLCL